MYRMLTVCLTLSFIFGETNLINQTNIKTAVIKKEKTESNSDVDVSVVSRKAIEKTKSPKAALKREKRFKKNHPGYKDGETTIDEQNVFKTEVSGLSVDKSQVISEEELIYREKQARMGDEETTASPLNYIQGPKAAKKHNQPTSMTRDHEGLFISEYAEGSQGNNKYMEVYNGSGESVDLSEYYIMQNSNGGPWNEYIDQLVGTLAPGDVYVIANSGSNDGILAEADLLGSGICYFNGDDAREH